MGLCMITSDEPGHFRLFVEGEDIIDADYRLFYVHRGMEKVAESRLNYDAVTFLADRICGICGNAHSVAYAEAVEHAQGIEVPVRAQYIRSILLEVERLHSHLLNLGWCATTAGSIRDSSTSSGFARRPWTWPCCSPEPARPTA